MVTRPQDTRHGVATALGDGPMHPHGDVLQNGHSKTTTARSSVRDKEPYGPRVLVPCASLREARVSSWSPETHRP